jgi:hypothetical protein
MGLLFLVIKCNNVFFFLQLSQTGPENATENERGVNYRALNDLFHISHNRGDTIMYEINVQMIEIYNEQIRDLLGSNGSEKKYPFSPSFIFLNLHVNTFCKWLMINLINLVYYMYYFLF